MDKIRVMYVVSEFPQISQTYIRTEIEAIRGECDVLVIGLGKPNLAYRNPAPHRILTKRHLILDAIEEFRPHVLHSHYLYNLGILSYIARKTGIPYTVRAHSFDVLPEPAKQIRDAVPLLNDELCLGVLTFPFTRPALERIGSHSDKLHDCFPVVHYKRFYDPSPNGEAVMNVGACLPKKKMEDFLQLAAQLPGVKWNLYALGYNVGEVAAVNQRMGSPANIIPPVDPEDMPAEYKKHRWPVYTASKKLSSVGWPMAIAEAQASGVGVCMANLRPDLREYVGDAGFLYDSLSDVKEIISKPFPEELRRKGFELARRSDISVHKTILIDLWRKAHRPEVADAKRRRVFPLRILLKNKFFR